MAFQAPITIFQAIDNIHKKNYLLPAIQRELVWDTDQIELLFDSLIRDYPIGSFLFWHVNRNRVNDYQFYEFIRDYHERDKPHNPKANVIGESDITAILDGQQRLTALYIGLRGKYAYKIPYKRWDNPLAFPDRELYINLLRKAERSDDIDKEYDFNFLTKEEAKEINENTYWFKVGEILNLKEEYEVNDYLIDNNLMNYGDKSKFANKTLFKLHSVIYKNPVINFYLEADQSLDKVLNIFIRVNSAGTPLSYSDLLLSIATAQWDEKDAREEIIKFVDEINKIGDGFNFDKNFVLKACLVLSDFKGIAFKVDNFNRKNMLTIEKNWETIIQYLRLAINLVDSFGYNRDTLTSTVAIIPIAYYLLNKEAPKNYILSSSYIKDRKNINKWLIIALIKRIFGGQPDSVLRPVRNILKTDNSTYPIDKIFDHFKGGPKSLVFIDEEIEDFVFYKYGESYTFSILALLYPTLDYRNKFHIDHIFPKSLFTKKKLTKVGIAYDNIDTYLDNFNSLANLQLLEGIPNQEKSNNDFKKWLFEKYPKSQERKEYMGKHYIPEIDLSINNFEEFIIKRKKLMLIKYKSILK